MVWTLAEATSRFGELFEKALREGPERVTRDGWDEVVVVAAESFNRLRPRRRGFVDFPSEGNALDEIEIARDHSLAREVGPVDADSGQS